MKKLFFLFLLILPMMAKASLLLEPWGGVNVSRFDYAGAKENGAGLAYGGKVAYQMAGMFQLGLDLATIRTQLDDKYYSQVFRQYQLSPYVGIRLPILLKFYAGLTAARGRTKIEANGNTILARQGQGILLGAGYTLLPLLDINLEYRQGQYKRVTENLMVIDDSAPYRNILLTLSFPFKLLD